MTEVAIKRVFTTSVAQYAINSQYLKPEDIVWTNISYDPEENVPHMFFDFFSDAKYAVGIGEESLNRVEGSVQLTLRLPSTEGERLANNIVTELDGAFKRGTVLTYDGVGVRILGTRILKDIVEPDWFWRVWRIRYRADILN